MHAPASAVGFTSRGAQVLAEDAQVIAEDTQVLGEDASPMSLPRRDMSTSPSAPARKVA
jgi:hypothetical protein